MVTLSVLLLMLGAALSEGCMCMPNHAHSHFCKSDFVLQVTVLDTDVDHDTYTQLYQAHVSQAFKMPQNSLMFEKDEEDRDIVQLTTASEDSLCGAGLKIGDTYIVGGRLRNGNLRISLCGLKVTSDENSIKRMTYYSGHPEMCDCEVRVCYGHGCDESDGDECTTDDWNSSAPDSCTDSVCSRSADGTCHWADVDTCQRKRNLPKWLKAASARSLFSKKQRGT